MKSNKNLVPPSRADLLQQNLRFPSSIFRYGGGHAPDDLRDVVKRDVVKRDVVKYELAAMKSRAALMDAMGAVVKGQVSFTDHLTDRAIAL